MKIRAKHPSLSQEKIRELRCALARKIAAHMGSAENRAMDIP